MNKDRWHKKSGEENNVLQMRVRFDMITIMNEIDLIYHFSLHKSKERKILTDWYCGKDILVRMHNTVSDGSK